nr:DNA-directed RNA polymerase II subunit RPB7-like [Cherax quadricarinatus]
MESRLLNRDKPTNTSSCWNKNRVGVAGHQNEMMNGGNKEHQSPTISLEHEILLHPRYFGPQLMDTVRQMLFTEVEGTCTGNIVCEPVLDTGSAKLSSIMIQDLLVVSIMGEALSADTVQFLDQRQEWHVTTSCQYYIPCFHCISYLQEVVIQQDDEIRVKIVGTRVDATDIFAIGTLMDDYLGLTS